jgi:predicted permease
MGIPLVAGREFRDQDNPATSQPLATTFAPGVRAPVTGPRYVIVNQSFAKKYFAGRNPVGMHVARNEKYDPAEAYEVVGVVQDVHYFGLRQQTQPMMYVAVWRDVASGRALVLRTTSQAVGVPDAVRREVTALDAAVPVLSFRTIEQQIDNNIMEDRLMTTLSGFFGALALLLAAVGLYGVISYSVTRRTREIGIRMALGAERGSVVWLVGRHAAALVLIGAAIGIPAALSLSKLVKSFLYGIKPQDTTAIVASLLALLLVAAVASAVPARRATRVDPMEALRQD